MIDHSVGGFILTTTNLIYPAWHVRQGRVDIFSEQNIWLFEWLLLLWTELSWLKIHQMAMHFLELHLPHLPAAIAGCHLRVVACPLLILCLDLVSSVQYLSCFVTTNHETYQSQHKATTWHLPPVILLAGDWRDMIRSSCYLEPLNKVPPIIWIRPCWSEQSYKVT